MYKEVHSRELIEIQEKELENTNARLRELDKQKSEFLSFASHQLRTPLTAIKWSSGSILDGTYGPVPDALKEPLETMLDQATLMSVFINDYLNVSRIEQGTMEYRFVPANVATVLKGAVAELEGGYKSKGLYVRLNIEDEHAMVWGDPSKLTQIFTNLIDNALKYTPQGGITITLKKIPERAKVHIELQDTGIGMDTKTLESVFAKFMRGENAKEVNSAGSGLGLFIVKTFIKAHKGTIAIASDGLGKGSTFTLEFPLLVQADIASAAAAAGKSA